MDRKTNILLAACFAALFLWQWLLGIWFPPVPKTPGATNSVASVTNIATTNAVTATTNIGPVPVSSGTNRTIVLATNIPERIEVLETPDAIYTFTSLGGGLKRFQLKRYLETVGCDRATGTNLYATLNEHARLPVFAMQAGDVFGDNDFTLKRISETSLTAEKVLPSGLRVAKQFELGTNYQITASVICENRSAQNIALPEQQLSVGTATPMGPRDPLTLLGVFWSDGEKPQHIEEPWFEGGGGCFKKTPRLDYGPITNHIKWTAVQNQFFAIAVVPANTNSVPSGFEAHRIDLPRPSAQDIASDSKIVREPRGLEALVGFPATTISANQILERRFTIYAGPKQEKLLARVGPGTDAVMEFGFWSPISKVLLRAMNGIHRLIGPIVPEGLGKYAMSLVTMTILIKVRSEERRVGKECRSR